MKLDIWTNDSVFTELAGRWNTLLQHSHNNLIFLTLEWQRTWWEAYHPGELHVVVGRTDDGDVVAIAPWFIQRRDSHSVIRTIGCVDVTDYLDIIVKPDHAEGFLSALANHISNLHMRDVALQLCNIPAGSLLLEQLPPLLEARGFATQVSLQEVCPVILLPETWDDYLNLLNKKQRHELRRKMRRVGEQADWYIVDSRHDLQAEIETFLGLMAASAPEKSAFLADPQNATFFRLIIPRLFAAGWLKLCFLTINAEPAATYFNLDYNNRILVYNSGQDVAQYGSYSAGIVLLAYCIRHAIENGREAFDFLRGNETYKYQLGGQDTQIFLLKAQRV